MDNTPQNALELERQGDIYSEGNQHVEALQLYLKSQTADKTRAQIYLKLGKTYLALTDYEQAKNASLIASTANPPLISAKALYAESLLRLGDVEEAEKIIEEVFNLQPRGDDLYVALQVHQKILAEGDNAELLADVSRRILQIKPDNYGVVKILLTAKKLSDKNLDILEEYSAIADRIKGVDNMHDDLFYGLANAYERLGDFKNAAKYIKRANAIFAASQKYNIKDFVDAAETSKILFSKEFYEKWESFGDNNSTPIFIVGMPRSSTSLTEQILASHSKVKGCGEMMILGNIVKSIGHPNNLMQLKEEHLKQMTEAYLKNTKFFSKSDDDRITTDKMPANYYYLGFLPLLFPKAKIIHCVRDLRDVAMSNYFQKFLTGNEWAQNMDDIVTISKAYKELMQHWKEVLPIKIYDFNYEDLLENQEEEIRKLLAFCDLEWQDGCLNYHKNKRIVNTASKLQVKQPIFKSSLGKWKNYEPFFGKELRKLGELN